MKTLDMNQVQEVNGGQTIHQLAAEYCKTTNAPDSAKVTVKIERNVGLSQKYLGGASATSSTTLTTTCGDARRNAQYLQ